MGVEGSEIWSRGPTCSSFLIRRLSSLFLVTRYTKLPSVSCIALYFCLLAVSHLPFGAFTKTQAQVRCLNSSSSRKHFCITVLYIRLD